MNEITFDADALDLQSLLRIVDSLGPQVSAAVTAFLATSPAKKDVGDLLDWIDRFTYGLDELRGEVARYLPRAVEAQLASMSGPPEGAT